MRSAPSGEQASWSTSPTCWMSMGRSVVCTASTWDQALRSMTPMPFSKTSSFDCCHVSDDPPVFASPASGK